MFSQPLTSDWRVWGYYWCDVRVLSEQIEVTSLWSATGVIVEAEREDGEQEHRGVRERRDQSSGWIQIPSSLLAQSKHGPADNVWRQYPLNYFLGLLCVWANDLSQVCVVCVGHFGGGCSLMILGVLGFNWPLQSEAGMALKLVQIRVYQGVEFQTRTFRSDLWLIEHNVFRKAFFQTRMCTKELHTNQYWVNRMKHGHTLF